MITPRSEDAPHRLAPSSRAPFKTYKTLLRAAGGSDTPAGAGFFLGGFPELRPPGDILHFIEQDFKNVRAVYKTRRYLRPPPAGSLAPLQPSSHSHTSAYLYFLFKRGKKRSSSCSLDTPLFIAETRLPWRPRPSPVGSGRRSRYSRAPASLALRFHITAITTTSYADWVQLRGKSCFA